MVPPGLGLSTDGSCTLILAQSLKCILEPSSNIADDFGHGMHWPSGVGWCWIALRGFDLASDGFRWVNQNEDFQ